MKRILVVDDEQLNRSLLEAILGPHGYEIVMGKNGEEGFALAMAGDFDLIITDNTMPVMTGVEMVARLQEQSYARTIIMLSGDDEVRNTPGLSAFVLKPWHNGALVALVESLVA